MNSPLSPTRYAWFVVLLLFPVALLNYLDRQMIASMKSSVMAGVDGMSLQSQWGYMLGQFKWSYAILSPLGGFLADRFSRRWTICASLVAWSVVTWLTGHATTYGELLWTRTAMGISEAFYIPAALAMISDYHRGPTRSRATGLHQMGIYCGVILGGFAGYVADAPALGWRWAFGFTGLTGILYAVPLAIFLRDRREPDGKTTQSPAQYSGILSNCSFWLLVACFTLPALAGWIVRDWMPAILQQSFNISQGLAGVSATLYWQVAAIVAALGGGWLADRWMRHTPRGRIYTSALGMAFIIPALFGVGNAPALGSFPLAIGSLVLFGVGWGFFDANNMPILSQIAAPGQRATGYGIMNFVSISCGGFADWGFGVLRDRHVPLNAIFGIFAAACALSVVLMLLVRPRSDA